jgi:hypothetical protein
MSSQTRQAGAGQPSPGLLRSAEDQISDMLQTLEEQDAQVWAYLIGGLVALIVGVIAAYYYAETLRERRKSRLEKIKDSLRGGINL